ncbi:ferredoxin [Streptomyces katsurahamanus]|uniref:Ferredoxin n=1 Tax=Streptomyces katsurahamanus TaxID=2577098 RepID=A0ABW9P3B4_9ACTN|nr:ferredoxin [Streptomyces katsurahamanus]MQS39985.1 ferredoxin [Streptomyces katsurahamanus]
MEVRVDRDRCAGSGLCVSYAPEVFDQSEDDGKVLLKKPLPGTGAAGAVRAMAARCPTGAITVHGHGHGHGPGEPSAPREPSGL